MNKKTFPPTILSLRKNSSLYGLLLLEKGEDESLYLKFPRRNPYSVKSNQSFENTPRSITYEENTSKSYAPYISYHQSGVIHVNYKQESGKKSRLIDDKRTTKKLDLLNKSEFIPFCSVLLSINILNYDQINHLNIAEFNYIEFGEYELYPRKEGQKQPSNIVLNRSIFPEKAILYIEVFIHKQLDNTKEMIEFSPAQKVNLIEQITINNTAGLLSYTILVKYINAETENPKGEVIVNVFNKDEYISLSMV